MGVNVSREDQKKLQPKKLTPTQKFRAGVFVVIAAMRMSEMEEQWRGVRVIGEEVEGARERALAVGRKGSGKVRWGIREV